MHTWIQTSEVGLGTRGEETADKGPEALLVAGSFLSSSSKLMTVQTSCLRVRIVKKYPINHVNF